MSEKVQVDLYQKVQVDLYQLAMDAGMTGEQYMTAIEREYSCYIAVILAKNPGLVFVHTAKYLDHDIEISARRIEASNASIN